MQYLLLLHSDPEIWSQKSEAEMGKEMARHSALIGALRERGKYLGSNALQPTHMSTTVRLRDGQTLITDGPFAETKEQLGGYYLIDAKDLDDAMAIAARIPDADVGGVEIRPIMDVGL